ncbi:MAG: site-specific DNA-methyltransferase [Thermodesulfovibrionales bacterium]
MPTLTWLTREADLKRAQNAPYRLLESVPDLSYGEQNTENMLIQGDNLDALKALLPFYAGRIKCIYIDPPFNTEQAFEHYDDNLEHSIWLAILYPRLELLRNLLLEEGTIFVHIDDNELPYLIVLLDEIFGRRNRISLITFKQGAPTGHKAINPGLVTTTNYIAIYAKSKKNWKPNRVFTSRQRDKRYGQFIHNYEMNYVQWKLITLNKAFAESLNMSAKDVKKRIGDEYNEQLNSFVITHAERVIREARPDYENVGESAKKMIDLSKQNPTEVFLLERADYPNMYFKDGERWLFYKDKLKEIDGELVAGEPLTNLWDDVLSNNLHNEGGVTFPKGKKPEGLIKRIMDLVTTTGDLILDSFLGSGTTCAVAHKMGRRYIGIEMGEHAVTHCVPRLKKVIEGEQGGISKAVNWQGGGGFRFYRLGDAVFDEAGKINAKIRFDTLAAHVWFCETKTPLTKTSNSPLLGVHNDTAYYLLYNGILGDKRPAGGNVLTGKLLKSLPQFEGPKIIYGETSRLGAERLRSEGIVFKQIPYDIKAR